MKPTLILLIVLFAFKSILAQESDEDLRLYFSDAEFFLAEEEYVDALYDYLELYNNGFEDNANINYRIGICYLYIPGQKDKAIPYLEEAVKNTKLNNRESVFREKKAPLDAYLYLGNAYRVNNDLDMAIKSYNKYRELLPSSDKANIEYIDKQIDACNMALKYMENPVDIQKTNLGDLINNNASNYKAVISGDGNTLIYMNELPFYDAVYFSHFENGRWTEPVNITSQIQSDGDQYVTSISYDGTQLLLTKEDNFNSDIYTSIYKNEQWTKSMPLAKPVNSKYWESHASISKDGKTLYFTSNRRGGFGEMDIYKSVIDEEGEWDNPRNLGSVINSTLNEDTPFITDDGKSLFFSSQGHSSMGGYDIYISSIDDEGNWTAPVNLGYPINTTDDDLFYYPWKNGRVAYLALLEPDGYGKEDIYKIHSTTEAITEEIITEKIDEEVPDIIIEKEPVEEEVEEVAEEIVEEVEEIVEEEVIKEEEPVEVEIVEFELSPVYFRFDKFSLTEAGQIKLDKVATLLDNYTGIEAELHGHTDAKGPAEYNQRLSEKRASSALDYLVSKGINNKRLKAIGQGETQFAAINTNPDGSDNPEGRKYNRRVELILTGIDESRIKIEKTKIPENLQIK
ncbi:MAG: PD40 domain-containing protein [Bacteroidales bacterium]|nr:MAG: PD40 domain-containing protein [Bacteroidales bacterium]